MSNKFAIFVTVKIKEDMVDDFLAHSYANATSTIRDESQCHIFRIMQSQDDPTIIHYYEVYSSAADLDKHRDTVHYQAYSAAVASMIIEKTIVKMDVLQ